MKRSEHYKAAMIAVINSAVIPAEKKVEILETLVEDKRVAAWNERAEEEKNNESLSD